jgi:glucose-1-phosphate thymidylyltransferase
VKALILAAGYATRLYPLTKDTPKPLLKLHHRSILDYILERIEHVGDVEQILIVTNNKFYNQFEDWLQPKLKGCPYRYKLITDGSNSVEDRLGAIGDIKLAIDKEEIQEDLLVVGGDNLFDFDLNQFVEFSSAQIPFHSICLYLPNNNHTDLTQYGIAQITNDSRIQDFEEKPEFPKSNLISTCIYFFPKEKLRLVNEYLWQGNRNDTPGSYIHWLTENDRVYGKIFDGIWFDLGDFDSLTEALVHLNGHEIEAGK